MKKRTKKLLSLRRYRLACRLDEAPADIGEGQKFFGSFFSKKNTFLPEPVIRDDPKRLDYERQQSAHAWRLAESAASPREARRWLERAHRFTPGDQNLAFALATARLADGDPAAARALFETMAARHGGRELFAGVAASAHMLGDRDAAVAAIARALSGFAATPEMLALARACLGGAAWCALTADGVLHAEAPGALLVTLDGAAVSPDAAGRLPNAWRAARTLAVTHEGAEAAGSPIDLAARRRTEGFVELTPRGIAGWAWHPAAPETDPVLRVANGRRTAALMATDLSVALPGSTPLARPRGFARNCDTSRPMRVLGQDGRDLWGSPLGGGATPPEAVAPTGAAGVAVVIPVHRGAGATLACVHSVLATIGRADTAIVVNDASPEPGLVAALAALAAAGRITLLPACAADPARNMGFPTAANVGLAAANGRDAVLLNSDTLVFPGWLAGLRQAAHGAPDIGTATPLSNDATIFTYPDPAERAPMPSPAEGAALARLAARANRGVVVEAPTAHGFCMFVRADCLHRTGLLRAGLFAQGYGEENDFCERARALGFRHVAAPGVYVAHQGGVSFGPATWHLLRRNMAVLEQLHPAYRGRVEAFIAADPLAQARARLDLARLRAAAPGGEEGSRGSILLVTHGGVGGTARAVQERAASIRARGLAPVHLRGEEGATLLGDDTPNLRFRLPGDGPSLLRVLRSLRPVAAELHHLMGHDPSLAAWLARLALPTDIWVHDYGWLCPRLALVTGEARFCGEPPAAACAPCVAQWGQAFEPPIDAASLRARSAGLMAGARRVVVSSGDVAARIRRHFPAAAIDINPLQDDPAPAAAPDRIAGGDGMTHVAVVGAIGMEKGYGTLLACARDAAARGLALRFTLVGYTIDDAPLLETGRVFVTGPFAAAEAATLIAGVGAQFAFLPSIWPETWCFALSDAWDAGLDAVVFDIGTPALRVRRTGRGAVLPLGLPPAAVNDALLNPQTLACRSGARGAFPGSNAGHFSPGAR